MSKEKTGIEWGYEGETGNNNLKIHFIYDAYF